MAFNRCSIEPVSQRGQETHQIQNICGEGGSICVAVWSLDNKRILPHSIDEFVGALVSTPLFQPDAQMLNINKLSTF